MNYLKNILTKQLTFFKYHSYCIIKNLTFITLCVMIYLSKIKKELVNEYEM